MSTRARRVVAVAVAGVVSTVPAVGPAAAQRSNIADLGFEIDPTEGPAGTVVTGQVDVDDIKAHCVTDLAAWVRQFIALDEPENGDAANGDADGPENDTQVTTPYQQGILALAPGGFLGDDYAQDVRGVVGAAAEDPELFTLGVAGLYPVVLADELSDEDGDGVVDERGLVEASVSQWFVMVFTDRATGEPIEPVVSFDRTTGEGRIEVPDLAPGRHPLIATCAGLPDDITDEDVAEAIEAGTTFVEENLSTPLPTDPTAPEFAEAAGQVLPIVLRDLLRPKAFGVELFTVPGDEPPSSSTTSSTTTTVPSQPNGGTPPKAQPAQPVSADPSFVG